MNEFFHVLSCSTARTNVGGVVHVIREGTTKLKSIRINSLIHEYEIFRMERVEDIQNM